MKRGSLFTKLIVIGIMAFILVGCKKEENAEVIDEQAAQEVAESTDSTSEEVNTTDDDAEDADSIEGANTVNPMVEITDDMEIADMSYGIVIPYGVNADDVESFVIADKMLERRFSQDGVDFVVRIKKGEKYEDISGLYYSWSVSDEVDINSRCKGHSMRYLGEDTTIDLVTWYDDKTGANYALSAEANDLEGFDLLAYVDIMYGEGNKMDDPMGIPGVPPMERLEESFNSFYTWAGLQSFYGGIQFDELSDDVAIAMAAFSAQENYTGEPVYSEDGAGQIISVSELNEASMDLFGECFDIKKADANVMMQSHLAVMDDGSIDVALGDWGLVVPQLEILTIDKISATSEEFIVNVRYYPYSYEDDKEMDTIPSYACRFTCVPSDDSRYGFVIMDMAASIVE